jgi:phosphohistidine phosphatase
MKIYLVQHAEAMSDEQHPERPLTEIGRRHANSVAKVAAEMGVEVVQIRHSGKTRAQQTAAILGESLSPIEGIVEVAGLAPMDAVAAVAEEIDQVPGPIMLVGHLPFMERLAGFMLTGQASQAVIEFSKGSIVCLEKTNGPWRVTWILTPQIAATADLVERN